MPTPEALLMAVLAMDVYSRGYNPTISDGIDNTPTDKRGEDGLGENPDMHQTIGAAKIFWTLEKAGLYDQAEDKSFHAIAYQLTETVGEMAEGTVVIAFRGTDNLNVLGWGDKTLLFLVNLFDVLRLFHRGGVHRQKLL